MDINVLKEKIEEYLKWGVGYSLSECAIVERKAKAWDELIRMINDV